jgi:hypothetical protein
VRLSGGPDTSGTQRSVYTPCGGTPRGVYTIRWVPPGGCTRSAGYPPGGVHAPLGTPRGVYTLRWVPPPGVYCAWRGTLFAENGCLFDDKITAMTRTSVEGWVVRT